MHPITATCPRCGAPLSVGARFCKQCGTPVTPLVVPCARCGTPLRADARFCKQCGTPSAPPTAASPLSRRRANVGSLVLALLLAMGLLGGGFWLTGRLPIGMLPPSPGGTSPVTADSVVIPALPAVALEHPTGAQLHAPAGTFLGSAPPTLTTLDQAPPTAPFGLAGLVYRISAPTVLNPLGPTSLDLPAGSAGERAMVFIASAGRWLRLPSTPITLANGSPGQRITLDGAPLPWTLAVVAPPAGATAQRGLLSNDSLAVTVARLEQLRLTDRAAFARELPHALDAAQMPSFGITLLNMLSQPAVAAPARAETKARLAATAALIKARLAFLEVAARIQGLDAASDPRGTSVGLRQSAFAAYRRGLTALWEARTQINRAPDKDEPLVDLVTDPASGETYGTGEELSLVQLIEADCATFAPWGLDLMRQYTSFSQVEGASFDLRVLPYYGALPFVDVPLIGKGELVPPFVTSNDPAHTISYVEVAERDLVKRLGIVEGQARRTELLRFYSPSVYNWSFSELVAFGKDLKGWSSAVLAAATLATGSVTGAAAVFAGYEVIAPIVEQLYLDPYIKSAARADAGWGMAVGSGYEAIKFLGEWHMTGELSLSGGATDLLLSFLIDHGEIAMLNEVRSAADGTLGYADTGGTIQPVPPIIIFAHIYGPVPDLQRPCRPAWGGCYEEAAHGLLGLALRYDNLSKGGYNLHQRFSKPTELDHVIDWRLNAPDVNYASNWQTFAKDLWPSWRYSGDPLAQQVRFALEDRTLAGWASAAGVPVNELLKTMRVQVYRGDNANGRDSLVLLDSERVALADHQISLEDTTRWFALSIEAKQPAWREVSATPEPPATYAGPRYASGERPVYHYSIQLVYQKQVLTTLPVSFFDPAHPGVAVRACPSDESQGCSDRADLGVLRTNVARLRPGVWNLGAGFPNEVVLREEGDQMAISYPAVDTSVVHQVSFTFFPCASDPSVTCFHAIWANVVPQYCTGWNVAMDGVVGPEGKRYVAQYTDFKQCPNAPNGPTENTHSFEITGHWLRDGSSGVDSSFPASESPNVPPIGTNPMSNEQIKP